MQINNKTEKSFALLAPLMTFVLVAGSNSADAKGTENTIKNGIDTVSDFLKNAVDKISDDIESVQTYLDNYHWKGMIEDEAASGVATLGYLTLNGHQRAVAVKPGERIEGEVNCSFDRKECSPVGFYRVVIGIKGQGAQTTVGNSLGAVAGSSIEKFVLIAPKEAGVYQIRFRSVEAFLEGNALAAWIDEQGNEPDGTTTLGLIFVN